MRHSAILTTLFNHSHSPYFKNNWQNFIYSLRQQNLLQHLFVCEVLLDHEQSIIDSSDFNHWTVHNNSYLWHKESALNYLLSKVPTRYNAIIAMDNDIICNNSSWYNQTSILLDTNIAVQPYASIEYLLNNAMDLDLIDHGIVEVCQNSHIMTGGNPGLLVAYQIEYLKHMGGFFDKCLVGGGDIINMMPFYVSTHGILFNVFNMVPHDSLDSLVDYIAKGQAFLQQQSHHQYISSYPDNHITHLFHGYWNDRNYANRYSLLKGLSIKQSFHRNANNFYEISHTDDNEQFKKFFTNRLSMNKQDEPIIVSSSKYAADNENVLWLKPNSYIYCYNIKKIELVLNKQQDLGNIEIFINDQLFNSIQLINNNQQIFTYDNPKKITIRCSQRMNAPSDQRELGLFISDLHIVPENTDAWQPYPLKNII